jgi:hypothetical protein
VHIAYEMSQVLYDSRQGYRKHQQRSRVQSSDRCVGQSNMS